METTSHHHLLSGMAGKMDFGTYRLRGLVSSSREAPSPIPHVEKRADHLCRKRLGASPSKSSSSHHDICCCQAAGPVCATASPNLTRQNKGRNRRLRPVRATETLCRLMSIVFFTLFVSTPVSAVRIRATNCLPESFQNQNPPFIQWVPVEADAKFDTKSEKHNFQYIVWGNVTGSIQQVQLPKPEDQDYWTNPDKINGKIINSDNSENGTTVKSSISMLSYMPWSHRSFFCGDSLVNGSCPLPPVFNTTGNV